MYATNGKAKSFIVGWGFSGEEEPPGESLGIDSLALFF